MAFKHGFTPDYDGFINFSTGSFAPSSSVGSADVQNKILHNLEWLYGTSTQIRVNWRNRLPKIIGTSDSKLPVSQSAFLFSDGPFILSQMDDGTPFPIYVRVGVAVANKAPSVTVGATVFVNLRQEKYFAKAFSNKSIGNFFVQGISGSTETIYELTTPSSSLSTSSSIVEIIPQAVRSGDTIITRVTRSVSSTTVNTKPLMCYLDFYAQGDKVGTSADGLGIYSVFAQEFCPKKSK